MNNENAKPPTRKHLRFSHRESQRESAYKATYKLVLGFPEIKIQHFHSQDIFAEMPSNYATGWQGLGAGQVDGITAQKQWDRGLYQRKLLQRTWHLKGHITERSFNDALCSPLTCQVSNWGRKQCCGLASPFYRLITLTLWNTRLALPEWDSVILEARVSHRQLDFSSSSQIQQQFKLSRLCSAPSSHREEECRGLCFLGLAGVICADQEGITRWQSPGFVCFAGMLTWDYCWCNTQACVCMLAFKSISLLLNLEGKINQQEYKVSYI